MTAVERIFITNLPVPTLVGDYAIAVGALHLLRADFPEATILGTATQLTEDTRSSLLAAYDIDHLIPRPDNRFWGAVAKYATPTIASLLGARAAPLLTQKQARLVREIAEADLFILRGSGTISSPHLACDLWGLRLDMLNAVMVARALGVPYALWGHTIWDLDGPLSKYYLWPLIADSRIAACREEYTYQYLLAEGAPAECLAVLPDTAFAVPKASAERIDAILHQEQLDSISDPIVGINVRPLWTLCGDYDNFASRYVKAFSALIDHIINKLGMRVLLLPHGYQTEEFVLPSFQDDRAYQQNLLGQLPQSEKLNVLAGNYNPSELVGVYSRLAFIITTRLHAAILGAAGGTPSVIVSYEKNKTHGIARMLGLDDLVVDVAEISTANLLQMTGKLVDELDQRKANLSGAVSEIKAELDQYVRRTISSESVNHKQ